MSVASLLEDNNFDLKCRSITASSGHEVGWQTGASNVDPVFIGTTAAASGGAGCVSLGAAASAAGNSSVVIGTNAASSVGGNGAVVLGAGAQCGSLAGIAIGQGSAAGDGAIALGDNATAADGDIAIGRQAGGTNAAGSGLILLAGVPNPLATAAAAANFSIPVTINGVVYYIRASNTSS